MKHKITDELVLKAIAAAIVEGADFFIFEGKAYEDSWSGGNEDAYHEWLQKDGRVDNLENKRGWIETECCELSYDEDSYLVLTDGEADERTADYIREMVWAFNPSFLAEQTDLPEEIFQAIQDNGKCESNNDVILKLIEKCGDFDGFVQAAISADGRGHFLSPYDSEENEVNMFDYTGENEYLYVYKQ